MTKPIDTLLSPAVVASTQDPLAHHDANKKQWEKEFLNQQVRWQADADDVGQGKPETSWQRSKRLSEAAAMADESQTKPALQNTIRPSKTANAANADKAPSLNSTHHKALNADMITVALAADQKPLVAATVSASTSTSTAPIQTATNQSHWLQHRYSSSESSHFTVVVEKQALQQANSQVSSSQVGGLAVYRNKTLSLWLRSQDKQLPRLIGKALNFFKLKLIRLMVNGELIKKS